MVKNNRPKIIFVLSGGGARGLAHLGVLEVFKKENIKPDAIVGTSIGALIGGLYAAGIDIVKAQEMALKIGRLQKILLFASLPQKRGLIQGGRIEKLLKGFVGEKKIEDLDIPFYGVATDLKKGKRVIISKGSLVKAIRASIAVPGIFTPVERKDEILIDGGVIAPLPINIAYGLGADVVIASDVSSVRGGVKISSSSGAIAILHRSLDIMMDLLSESVLSKNKEAIIIKPQVERIGWMDFERAKEAIRLGRLAAKEKLKEIKK